MSLRPLIKSLLPDRAVQHVRVNPLYLWSTRQKIGIQNYGLGSHVRYSLSAPINRRRFQRLNEGLSPSSIALDTAVRFNTCPEARTAHEHFAFKDAESVDEIRSFIRNSRDRKCLLDVGSLFGTFSFVFASHGGQSIAIEPSQEPFDVLNRNIALNPSLNIQPFQLALSDHNGTLTMQPEWKHLIAAESGTVIRCTRLDDFVKEQDLTPDAIKIDVEGHELAVLQGGANYIRERKPIIFLEIDNWHAPKTTPEIINLLSSLGYATHNTRGKLIQDPSALLTGIRRVVCKPTSQAPA